MITLQKAKDKDFVLLNLTDPQMKDEEWEPGHTSRKVIERTLAELVDRVKPDLITISGDIAWTGCEHSFDMTAELISSFGIPWAVVWGNHDNEKGPEFVNMIADRFMKLPNFIYEKGDPTLGIGNYIISIEEEGKPIEAIFMLDSHDRAPYTDKNGETKDAWARLTDVQGEWLLKQSAKLREDGYKDATLICHIPIYAYRKASAAAFKEGIELKNITVAEANGSDCWNEGYTDSVGVQYENICSYPLDDGMLEVFKNTGLIRQMIAGHDHTNATIINYEDIKLIYGLKCGAGAYWNKNLNGGTVLLIGENGVKSICHEYVDVLDLL